MKEFQDYKRFPIQLSQQDIMLIHLFSNSDHTLRNAFENMDMTEENEAAFKSSWTVWETAAKQLFDQLEGHYSDSFLEAVIIEATKKLAESDKRNNELDVRLGKTNEKPQDRAGDALKMAQESLITL